jgi:16S rRNA (cytosine1402-N4)-methyltransferase
MADFGHASVLLAEVLEQLSPREGELFCDGTLGGAGHSSALMERGVRLIGIDRDPLALSAAHARLGEGIELHHAQFSEIPALLGDRKLDGLLLDLGVSSPQLDLPERGFSFMKEGPLDMRMDPTRGQTALELIRALEVEELIAILFEYGEERYAKRIAGSIKEAAMGDLRTTTQLAKLCSDAIPFAEQRKSKIHPATRTFQALRIAVNAELLELEAILHALPDLLAPGGRAAIISFHSLEDRLVKNRFRDLAWTTSLPPHLAHQAGERIEPVVEVLTRKPITATDDEIARNPRSRSAKLRACRRTAAPNLPSGAPPDLRH